MTMPLVGFARRPRSLLLASGAAILLAALPLCARRAAQPPPRPPTPDLATLIASLSEPGGDFDTDNLISNETSYLQVADRLEEVSRSGGAYLGVGPDQNFSYIARLRPRWAFILDIRRQNAVQHLLFHALFENAADPYQYLCRLLSRPCPAVTPVLPGVGVKGVLAAVESIAPAEETFARNLRDVLDHIARTGFPLSEGDSNTVRSIYRAFFREQLELRFHSHGRQPLSYHPTYRSLLLARSPSGRYGSFLDSPEDYRFVRELERGGRVVPVVGDFAGPHALKAIARFLREQGETVSGFYASNVEFYLLRDASYGRFVSNVRDLPVNPESVFIRAYFDYGQPHPAALVSGRSTTILQRIPRFLKLYDGGTYESFWDVCTADYLQ